MPLKIGCKENKLKIVSRGIFKEEKSYDHTEARQNFVNLVVDLYLAFKGWCLPIKYLYCYSSIQCKTDFICILYHSPKQKVDYKLDGINYLYQEWILVSLFK